MHSEERRKIIEEVSGISIYESRKERSLKELEKTEDRLKEVHAILRERTSYLNNLEKERQQALKYKKLEDEIKKFKASIIFHDLNGKKKESSVLQEGIEKKIKESEKVKKVLLGIRNNLVEMESKISAINSTMQKTAGFEQEKINREIADLRAELAGVEVRIKSYEEKLNEISRQKVESQNKIRETESLMKDLDKNSTTLEKKEKDVEAKKKELEALEAQRKKFYVIRSELKSAKERLEDKKSLLQTYANESEFLMKQINQVHSELFDKKTDEKKISSLKLNLSERKNLLEELEKKEIGLQKISFLNENEIDKKVKFGEKISRMDICPVCKSKITKEHLGTMEHESKTEVSYLKKGIESSEKELRVISEKKAQLKKEIEEISAEISKRDGDLIKTLSIEEKKGQIKNLQEKINSIKSEISYLDSARKKFELHFDENSNIEEKYESARIEVQDISLRNRENVSSEISFKQREIERYKVLLKRLSSEEEELTQDLDSLKENFSDKERILEDKRKKEEELTKRFQNLISERDELQKKVREGESNVFEKQTEIQ